MDEKKDFCLPVPMIDKKEEESLDILTERYNKLIKPSKIVQLGTKAGQLIPENIKKFGKDIKLDISESELYTQMMDIIVKGFKVLEEQAARFSISEKNVLSKVNQYATNYEIEELDEICLLRSYDLAKLVNNYKNQDTLVATLEGAGTGVFGFWGLPFNIVLSTFLYFRAVQSIAMFYGYDVKNDSSELVIASEVFTNALSPEKNNESNQVTSIIGKIMLMSHAEVVKQTAKKTWADMVVRRGVPLLLAQMRALANKSAQKALNKVGAKGLENSLFKEAFEQIGRKLALKTIGKAVPVVSAVISALIDTAQMKQVLEHADVFYQKRFILEKASRINNLIGEDNVVINEEARNDYIINAEIIE